MAEAVGFASAIAGLVALAGQIAKISYGYISDIRDASRTRGQYILEIRAFNDVLLRSEQAALDVEKLGVMAPRPTALSADVLVDCHDQLAALLRDLDRPYDGRLKRFTSALIWPLDEPQLKKHLDTLRRFRSIFSDFVVATILSVSGVSHNQLTLLVVEQDRSRILEWLQLPTPPRLPAESACEGTGQWFLDSDSYFGWRANGPSILWCYGKPGVGKSVLSSIIIRDLSQAHAIVAHYFCDFTAGKQQTAATILQSLIRQMLLQGDSTLIAVLKQCIEKSSSPPRLQDLFETLLKACKATQTGPYIILDALDELEDRIRLLPFLSELVHRAGCYVFVTSRHIPDVADAFKSFQQVELEANRGDLKIYIENELQAGDLAHAMTSGDIIDAIIDQSSGIFLLARLLMKHLLALTTVKQMRRAIVSLPSNLSEAYQSSMNRILAQPPARSALALRVIGWIIHAGRQLTTTELLHAFAVEEGEDDFDEENLTSVRMLLAVCVGLVVVRDDIVSMVHATAYEFAKALQDRFKNVNKDMATTCLLYLCLRVPFGEGPCHSVDQLNARLKKMPFLAYAARYWGWHARSIEHPLIPLICKLLEDFNLRASSYQILHSRQSQSPELSEAIFAALPTGEGPLHITAHWNLPETTAIYLEHSDPSCADAQGWTPLHWACSKGSNLVREMLLERGAAIDMRDSHGWTPLFWASFSGDVEAIKSLLSRGADHLAKDIHSWSALQWAASRGERWAVQALLDHHAQFKAQEHNQVLVASLSVAEARSRMQTSPITAVELAAENGDAPLVDSLLGQMSDDQVFNGQWKKGRFDPPMSNIWRALTKAESFRGFEVYLEDYQRPLNRQYADEDAQSWKSRLLHAAIRDDKILLVRLLLELGADVNYTAGSSGRSALHTAACRADAQFVQVLLRPGVKVNLADSIGWTALHRATLNGFKETVAALLTGGADVNAPIGHEERCRKVRPKDNGDTRCSCRSKCRTPLMLVCGVRNSPAATAIARLLLNAGADIAAVDTDGRTPMLYALDTKNLKLVQLFLASGAQIVAADNTNNCPLYTLASGHLGRSVSPGEISELLDTVLSSLPPDSASMEWGMENYWDPDEHTDGEKRDCPLSIALLNNKWDLFAALLERGAQLRTTRKLEPLLEEAVRSLRPTPVRYLLEKGADPSVASTALPSSLPNNFDAAQFEDFCQILSALVQAGLDINSKGYSGRTLTHTAVARNVDLPDITRVLLDTGGDPYLQDKAGLDAFSLAMLHQNVNTLSLLLSTAQEKPPPSGHWVQPLEPIGLEPCPTVSNALEYACICLQQHNLIDQKTADTQETFLKLAIRAGSTRTVAHLVKHGADYLATDEFGWQPLHWAIYSGCEPTVDVLIDAGADVHATTTKWPSDGIKPTGLYGGDVWGGSPLHLAAMSGSSSVAEKLLAKGADARANLSVRKEYCYHGHGPTPLHIALDTDTFYGRKGCALDVGRLKIAAMLVEHGADVEGVADRITLDDVPKFEGFEELWDRLRAGVTENGVKIDW